MSKIIRKNWSVFFLIGIFLFSFSSIYAFQLVDTPQKVTEITINPLSKLNMILGIKVYDAQGTLKTQYAKNDDLILDNFRKFLQAFFTNATEGSDCTLTKTTGSTAVIRTRGKSATSLNTYADSASGVGTKGGLIGIGTSATAPARTDYDLTAQEESLVINDVDYPVWTDATGNVTMQGTITSTDSYSVQEVGFFCKWVDTSGALATFMLFHDVCTAIPVVATDVICVSYTLSLTGTIFNRNFGNILKGIFSSVADAGNTPVTLYGMDGVGRAYYTYIDTATSNSKWVGKITYSPPIKVMSCIRISTSDAAPTVSETELTNIVEGYIAPSPNPSLGATTIIVRCSVTCTATRDVYSAGYYIGQWYAVTPESYYILLWHSTFSLVTVPSGQAIRITWTLTC